jgi:PEP-CTERM motif
MKRTSKLGLATVMVFFCLVAVPSAKADPIMFGNVVALQNNGTTSVNLLANPGVTLYGPQISFQVDITGVLPPGGSTVLQITYTEGGGPAITQTFPIPLFDGIEPPYTQLFTIISPGATFAGIPATLTISIPEGNSQTFTFIVAEPVPEPASIILLSLGGLGLWSRIRRSRE